MIKMYLSDCTTEVHMGDCILGEHADILVLKDTLPNLIKNKKIILKDTNMLIEDANTILMRLLSTLMDAPSYMFSECMCNMYKHYPGVFKSLILKEMEYMFDETYNISIREMGIYYYINIETDSIHICTGDMGSNKVSLFRSYEDAAQALSMVKKVKDILGIKENE